MGGDGGRVVLDGERRDGYRATCPPGCVCGGRLTEVECELRSDLLWAAVVDRPARRLLVDRARLGPQPS